MTVPLRLSLRYPACASPGQHTSHSQIVQLSQLLVSCNLQADFTAFEGKGSMRDQAAAAAALAQAAFAGHVPEAGGGGGGGGKGSAEAVPNTSADADLALALQMQEVRSVF